MKEKFLEINKMLVEIYDDVTNIEEHAIKEGAFGGKQIALFNAAQIVGNIIAWIVVAPVLDIIIYQEPANKVFLQGAAACLGNVVIIAILGTLLAVGYSKIGAKSSSLTKED